MKGFIRLGVIGILAFSTTVGFAQDDETRQAMGLPMMVGKNSTNRDKSPLSGKITIQGMTDSETKKPVLFVAVYFSGALVDRRQVSDSGSYFVPEVPRMGAVLSVEVDGIELQRFEIPASTMGNVRQDVNLNWMQIQNSKNQKGVVLVKNIYQRSDENEKIYQKALLASKDKKNDLAISLLIELLKKDNKDFVALTDLGTLHFKNGKYSEAESAYIKAIEQKPDFIIAFLNLGKLYLGQKQYDKSIVVLTKAVEIEPNSADANHYLGESYLQNKKGSKAVGYLNEAIKLAPIEKAEIHLSLAALYNGAGLKDKAVEEYKMFLEKVPNYIDKKAIEKYIKDNSSK